jgi:hypothetical protein
MTLKGCDLEPARTLLQEKMAVCSAWRGILFAPDIGEVGKEDGGLRIVLR